MQFLKILFWCLLAFVAALFTYGNWTSVPIQLWSGTEALVKLPFLLVVAFLIGFVPTYIYYHAVRWRLKQRLSTNERALVEARALPIAPPPQQAPPVYQPDPPAPPLGVDPAAEDRLA
ncbi:hypothetical protein [Sphingomonas oligophenolica]|uniref:hypothetical protein n=1 Tax=Sphingomonas oligophenolica TaxID=301154 RepID=UPI001F4FF9F6|nr:hypothetical protein [Sphingomonas oligophenolica]